MKLHSRGTYINVCCTVVAQSEFVYLLQCSPDFPRTTLKLPKPFIIRQSQQTFCQRTKFEILHHTTKDFSKMQQTSKPSLLINDFSQWQSAKIFVAIRENSKTLRNKISEKISEKVKKFTHPKKGNKKCVSTETVIFHTCTLDQIGSQFGGKFCENARRQLLNFLHFNSDFLTWQSKVLWQPIIIYREREQPICS